MSLAIVGLGLVTPFGSTPTENVMLLRASVPGPPPSRFRRMADNAPVYARYCRWIGAGAPLEDRLLRLARRACEDARAQASSLHTRHDTQIVLCTLPRAQA